MTTVIWIDWYSYHLSRFRALAEHDRLRGRVAGIELVGGCGVHSGLKFRDGDRLGLDIRSLAPMSDWSEVGQWQLARLLWRELTRLGPKTVFVPGYYTLPALAAAVWARLHGARSVLMSETTAFDSRRAGWRESLKRLLARALFDYGIVGGKPHSRYLAHLGFHKDRIARFYDVVDNAYYKRATDEARRSPAPYVHLNLPASYFLFVGRLSPEKNLTGLLREFAQYRSEGGQWSLVLVGDGPQRADLQEYAETLGVASFVRFEGLKSTQDTIPYYAFSGCFLLPSTREPWGLVVNEAMASSLPVIASTQCGCAEDLVNPGTTGFTFSPFQPGALAQRMLAMSTMPCEERLAMGRAAWEQVSAYSPQQWAEEVARIVEA
ncbi:MAG: glycosyltransferase family 4 protein [Bryobacterales bacterium]|nr:glycosyltransferase family 4 protein [Bryobacterales bacterium]